MSEAVEDADRWGLPEIAATLTDSAPEGFEVWPENMPIVDAWLAVATQWRAITLADGRVHWIGLDYAGVRVSFEEAAIVRTPDLWAGIRVMESAAARALNGYRD